MKMTDEFREFWENCIDRCELMEAESEEGGTTLTSNVIAVAYELSLLLRGIGVYSKKKARRSDEPKNQSV